jgi:predicted Zn-dependent protease
MSVKSRYWKDAAKLLVLFAAMWGLFFIIPWPSLHGPKATSLVSVEQEVKLGELILNQSILAPGNEDKLIQNKTIDSAVEAVTSRLITQLGTPLFSYHFYVVQKDEVNAFTLPGGNIVIYSGLLKFCNTPEELAAVLAHELGHAQKRHVITKLVNELGITFVLSVMTGGNRTLIRELFRTVLSGSFSREQEKEADSFGFNLLEKASIEPSTFSDFFRRLSKEKEEDGKMAEMLNTHPNNSSRIRAALLYKTAPGFKAKPLSFDWKRVREAIKEEKDLPKEPD